MCLCMYVAMSENRFLRFLPFRLFRISHSMKCQNMMGRPFVFERGAWNILTQNSSTLLSKINILISKSFAQIYIIFVTMWVCKIKGKNRSSRYQVGSLNVFLQELESTYFWLSTEMLFYIVKGFGLIKRGMRVKRKWSHFKCNQGFSSKAACHKKKKLTCHQGIIKTCFIISCCHACLFRIISCFWITDNM
jgi:hypothetical protein